MCQFLEYLDKYEHEEETRGRFSVWIDHTEDKLVGGRVLLSKSEFGSIPSTFTIVPSKDNGL